jgi:hypothetical protein
MKDKGLEFEDWIVDELPWRLNLSLAKDQFIKDCFSPFADFVRPLATKAPEEFDFFFKALRQKIKNVSKRTVPKGYKVVSDFRNNQSLYPNGKPKPWLVDCRRKCINCGLSKIGVKPINEDYFDICSNWYDPLYQKFKEALKQDKNTVFVCLCRKCMRELGVNKYKKK